MPSTNQSPDLLQTAGAVDPPTRLPVLVVEDEDGVRRMLGDAFERYGFSVSLAASGREAIEHFQHRTGSVVLLDVHMPDMDGPQTAAALKAINPEVRFCFMSGGTGDHTAETLQALGAATIFHKPFKSLNDVAQFLQQLAGSKPSNA